MKKSIITVLLCTTLLINSVVNINASAEENNENQAVVCEMVDAIAEKDWEMFTQLMHSEQQDYYEDYFGTTENQNGVKQIRDIELVQMTEVTAESARAEWLVDEYPILLLSNNIKSFVVALDCCVEVENEFFFNGINYFLIVLAEENGEMKVVQFNKPSLSLLESVLVLPYNLDNDEYERAMAGVNVIRQCEKGVLVNANNEMIGENFDSIRTLDDGICTLASGTNDFPTLTHYSMYSYPETINVKMNRTGNSEVITVEMETYIKGTLPNEWMGSWDSDALKAGAYCVKMVGWYKTLRPTSVSGGYHVTQYTQYYKENSNYYRTDAAVNAIRNSGMANSQGNLFYPEYAEGTDGEAGTEGSGKLRQRGSQYLASELNYGYASILNYYYSGSSYSDGDLVLFSYEE